MSDFKTEDLSVAAYLIAKKYPLKKLEKEGKFFTFCFSGEAGSMVKNWWFNPTDEMALIQRFVIEKERLFRFIKGAKNG